MKVYQDVRSRLQFLDHSILGHPTLPYVVPFAAFLILTELTLWLPGSIIWLYPLKTLLIGSMLLLFWPKYNEIEIKKRIPFLAGLVGILVFILWVGLEGYYPSFGKSSSFNPFQFNSPLGRFIWISFRLMGAAIVVPIMEELFWRSFLIRYLINPDFKKVPLGSFTWFSFVGTVILFGVEHHQWLVGIIAGGIYNLLYYRKKEVTSCIIAHAITNLVLGIYVLITHRWGLW